MWAAMLDLIPGQVRRRREREELLSRWPDSAPHNTGLGKPVLVSHELLCFPGERVHIVDGEKTLDP